MKDIRDILQSVYGYDTFRGQQEQIINHIMSGEDALVIMPTGGGKSLCYQIPAIASEGLTIVISPLIALMNDQVIGLQALGVCAAALHSHTSRDEQHLIDQQIKNKELRMLYVSPERINTSAMTEYLKRIDLDLIAIDEAHCVSIWGNDFRPDYVALSHLKDTFTDVPIIALTATADESTQKDIVKQLHIPEARIFSSSFERENIFINVYPGQKRIQKIIGILKDNPDQSGIIYCLSRKDTEKVSERLTALGYTTAYYHAGMDKDERHRVQRAFQNDEIEIICATIAFGMGIDKPNIRFVIHYSMPKNIEAYYQEIGRAGRDGAPSEAHLFYSYGDYIMLRGFIDRSEGNEMFTKVQYAKLERMWEFAIMSDCRTNAILSYFGEYREEPCNHCDHCLNPPLKIEGTVQAQKILSAIARAHQNIGIELVLDILRGSQKAIIRQMGLDQIKTFGIGRDVPRSEWRFYIIQLINKGVIAINYANNSKLEWTPLSQQVIKGEKSINLVRWVSPSEVQKAASPKINFSEDGDVNAHLLSQLKEWRRDLSNELNVPAYIILGNKVLDQLAIHQPENYTDLLKIKGIGENKLDKYGQDILRIVKEYSS